MPLNIPADLPTTSRRNRALYEHINQLADAIRSGQSVISHNMRTSQTALGTMHEALEGVAAAPAADSSLSIMRVKGIYDDVLLCYSETQDPESLNHILDTVPIYVLKPFDLRKYPFHLKTFDGITYTYISSQVREARIQGLGTAVETQRVFPAYVAGTALNGLDYTLGTQIIAAKNVGGVSFVFTPPTGSPNAGVVQSIEYVEIAPARVWAEYSWRPS